MLADLPAGLLLLLAIVLVVPGAVEAVGCVRARRAAAARGRG